MRDKKKENTEDRILNAARQVFMKKGMDGSRMQEIADEAGINKALLHYYFRSKQKLFEAIFRNVFSKAFPDIREIFMSDQTIDKKLAAFIDRYISLLINNPYLPGFLLREGNRAAGLIPGILDSIGRIPLEISDILLKEMKAGNIRTMDPGELIINIIALSIFPFAARPLIETVFFERDSNSYQEFLEKRRITIKEFVLSSILIK